MEDLEQYNAESDIVDSSMEDLEQYNAESDIVDSSTVELEQFDEDDCGFLVLKQCNTFCCNFLDVLSF
jgi:hypothetical protein